MPSLPPLTSILAKKNSFYIGKSRGGSSASIGKRMDNEVRHLLECLSVDVQFLIKNGLPLPSLPKGGCKTCGLQGKGYERRVPTFHKWTLAYLQDVTLVMRWRLLRSQFVVANKSLRLGTAIDDLAMTAGGDIVAIERKTGYADAVGTRKRDRPNHTFRITDSEGNTLVELPNTHHTEHRLQVAIGGVLLEDTLRRCAATDDQPMPVRTSVVYVAGESKVPDSQGRDLRAELNGVWLHNNGQMRRGASRVLQLLEPHK
jgi:hypothetical protein